jgi:hypothetical protein
MRPDRSAFIFDLVGDVATEPTKVLARTDIPPDLRRAVETYVAERQRHDTALLVVHREIFTWSNSLYPAAQEKA